MDTCKITVGSNFDIPLTGFVKLLLAVFLYMPVKAQQCSGSSINAYSATPVRLSTQSELESGTLVSRYFSVQFRTTSNGCNNWKLTVRASGVWRSGNHTLPLSETGIRFNSVVGSTTQQQIGITPAFFPLSQNEVVLIPQSNASLSVANPLWELKYDLSIYGGSILNNAYDGDYSTMLIFTLYNKNGQVISTSAVRAGFQIQRNLNLGSNIILQNGASNISLGLNSSADFNNGISDTKVNGMNVMSYESHQIIVKAAGNRLMANGLQGIPVSAVQLTVSVPSSNPAISSYTVPLSETATVVVSNPMPNSQYRNVSYTLKFSIAGNDPSIMSAQPGLYTTSIVFILVPN